MKVLLIGGSKGLGLEVRNALRRNHHEVVTLNRSEGTLDLTWDEERIRKAVKNGIDVLNGCDILLVSSGMGAYLPPTTNAATVEKLFQTNFLGPTIVFRAAQRALLKSKGKAVFISSITGRKPSSGGLSYYAATKGALNSWVMSESRRQAKHGVGLCTISPGFFESEMTAEIHPKLKAASMKNIPMNRFGESKEIAEFVVDVMRQSNWVIAGSNYECSGGA